MLNAACTRERGGSDEEGRRSVNAVRRIARGIRREEEPGAIREEDRRLALGGREDLDENEEPESEAARCDVRTARRVRRIDGKLPDTNLEVGGP
eukprot:3059609-Rhodomonas_salina.4